MPVEVILPKVDMDMETGRISKWFVDEGASVSKGELLFEIETNKATMEIDAPASGVLRDVVGFEGIDIAVGAAVAWIYAEGETQDGAGRREAALSAAPVPAKTIDVPTTAVAITSHATANGLRATPLARRLARAAGIALETVNGTGPNGRITRADIEAHVPASVAQPEPVVAAKSPLEKQVSSDQVRNLFAEGSYEVVPHTSMRRTIARRLVEAKTTIPHFYLTLDCNIDALLKLRADLNADAAVIDGRPAYKLSVNDMVIKAYALALTRVPDANVSWTDDGMLRHAHADIGVAVSIPGGLITPIVRHAEIKNLSAISNEMKDLGARARDGKLKSEEYLGGTGAVSNLGMFGIREFAAIVNPPHATILAVGAGERRAIVVGDDVKVATMMTVTLSTDHRAVDGALAAALAGAFRNYIERPMSMMV
jgi:pyruvate dehydrogenase E2 component (dihydrolipoamide acetyltransferase)